jgi:nucleoside-diphosphate-sugar epimerase
MYVLVIGASGNLGAQFAAALLRAGHTVRLGFHRTPLPESLVQCERADPFQLDLDDAASVRAAVDGVDAVVYCAGVLFAPDPEKFMRRTNYEWARTAVDASVAAGVGRFILLSFPHIEEGTTPEQPGTGSLDVEPRAIHASTRLEAERYVLSACAAGSSTTPVILRLGMVYGSGLRLVEAARRLLRWRLLPVWRERTWVHLIHVEDAARAVTAGVEQATCTGVYNVCDERPLTIQELFDSLADHFGSPRPLRLPAWCFRTAAWCCQAFTRLLRLPCPMHPDMIRMGMTSAVADTSRFRRELLTQLHYPSLEDGLREL